METPKSTRVNTGDDAPIYQIIDEFFKGIRDKINEPKDRPTQFKERLDNHYYLDHPTSDKTHMLFYQERVVAVVTETRTDSNYIQFDFFQNLEGILTGKTD